MDDTVGLFHISDGHGGNTALFVLDLNLAFLLHHGEFAATHSLDNMGTTIIGDHLLDCAGQGLGGNHMASQDLGQHFLVFWLQQGLDGAFWQSIKSLVDRRKHGERTRGLKGLDQTGSFHSSHQRGVVFGINGIFYDILGRIHWCTTDHRISGLSNDRGSKGNNGGNRKGASKLFHVQKLLFDHL